MTTDIKTLVERLVCAKLLEAIPNQKFLSMNGGTEIYDAEFIEPPFTVVTINEAEKVLSQQGLWLVQGSVQVVSHMDEWNPQEHAEFSRMVYHALSGIESAVGVGVRVHGLDVTDSKHKEEETENARIEVIDFTAGVTG